MSERLTIIISKQGSTARSGEAAEERRPSEMYLVAFTSFAQASVHAGVLEYLESASESVNRQSSVLASATARNDLNLTDTSGAGRG